MTFISWSLPACLSENSLFTARLIRSRAFETRGSVASAILLNEPPGLERASAVRKREPGLAVLILNPVHARRFSEPTP